MKIPPFRIERFFAAHEFTARYQLSCSDCEPLAIGDLLSDASSDTLARWNGMRFAYTETLGHPALRSEIAALYTSIRPEDVMVAVPEEAIFVLMNALLEPGDEAVVILPAYQSLHEVARSTGCQVRTLELDLAGGRWRLDMDRVAALITPATRLIVANFPHNPTGFLPERRELDQLIQIARRAGAYILGDEMYRFLEPNAEVRLPALCDTYEKGISLSGLSKAYGLPGLRIGWLALRDPSLLDRCVHWKDYTTICSSAPSEILALAALRARNRLLARCRLIVGDNTAVAAGFFSRHQGLFRWIPPQAGPVAFPAWTGPGTVDDFCRHMLQERSTVIVPGSYFDGPQGHFRIGLGRLDFPEAIGQLQDALRECSWQPRLDS